MKWFIEEGTANQEILIQIKTRFLFLPTSKPSFCLLYSNPNSVGVVKLCTVP